LPAGQFMEMISIFLAKVTKLGKMAFRREMRA
jgi:hypothetical protein